MAQNEGLVIGDVVKMENDPLFSRETLTVLDGQSLVPCLNGKSVAFPPRAYSSTTNYENPEEPGISAVSKVSLIEGKWKCILSRHEGRVELYDLDADPGEQCDLHAEFPERAAQMRGEIEAEVARTDVVYDEEEEAIILDRLEQLGYI